MFFLLYLSIRFFFSQLHYIHNIKKRKSILFQRSFCKTLFLIKRKKSENKNKQIKTNSLGRKCLKSLISLLLIASSCEAFVCSFIRFFSLHCIQNKISGNYFFIRVQTVMSCLKIDCLRFMPFASLPQEILSNIFFDISSDCIIYDSTLFNYCW